MMVFHWSLSDSKSPQVSRTLLSILAVLNNTVVWMVSTRPPTSKSSSSFNNPLVIVPKAPITIGINVTFMFHIFFNSLAGSKFIIIIIIIIQAISTEQVPRSNEVSDMPLYSSIFSGNCYLPPAC